MRQKTFIIYAVFFLLIGSFFLYSQQEVVLSIKEGVPAIAIALPDFIASEGSPSAEKAAQKLHQIISNDLSYSRVFKPLPESYYDYIPPLNPQKIQFKDWESIEAKTLLVGQVEAQSNHSFVFEAKLYDVKSKRFILGKKYQAKDSLLRLAAHKMADEIMKAFGEKPIFTSKIVFISNRDGNDELYMMDYDGHNQTRLTFNKVKDYMPAWSPDGQTIAYTSYRQNNACLYTFNPFKGKINKIHCQGTNYSPSFSPDGEKIAFCSTIEKGNSEIYVADRSGESIKRLTFHGAIDTAPSWSPTGRELAFITDRIGTPQVYIMDAEGSNLRRVSFGSSYHDAPAWSPTGGRLAYVSRAGFLYDLYVLNLRTNQINKLTESNARNETPSWSPDGRHLIFSSNLSGASQLYSIDYDGSNLKRLTSKGDNKLPDWSR